MPQVTLTRFHSNMHGGLLGACHVRTTVMHDGAMDVTLWQGPHLCGGGTLVRDGEVWRGTCRERDTRWEVSLGVGERVMEFRETI